MVTKLQILGQERFKAEICNQCEDKFSCECEETYEDMENCFENLNMGDCR